MRVTPTSIPEVLLIEPTVYEDDRGFFFESYNSRELKRITGIDVSFVQDNQSRSTKNVLRGLHYQVQQPQAKLVRAITGEIFDVAVDLRRESSTFGVWVGSALSSENKRQLWIPSGFAHGFLVLSDYAEILYKTSDYYAPECEHCIVWNDVDIAIKWPLTGHPILSLRDANGDVLSGSTVF